MSYDDQVYHRQRAEQCRIMAERASDPGIRERHRELAQLHARSILPSGMDLGPDGVTTA